MRAEYYSAIRCRVVMAAMVSLVSLSAAAQMNSHGGPAIHGVPPSVTSFGFGGHPGFHGVPPGVTSLNFGSNPALTHHSSSGHGHHHPEYVNPFYGGIYYFPYAVPYDYSDYGDYYVMSPGVDDTMEEEYARPGPTIFDSHGVSDREYPRPGAEEDYRSQSSQESASARPESQQPPQEQPATVLVFKDGHQMEVENYVIVGATLYNLIDGRAKKIALAELDLLATEKQNDDRGVEFKVPAEKLN